MITTSARLIIAAAGGNEKKAKMEVNCLTQGTGWKSWVDGGKRSDRCVGEPRWRIQGRSGG